jgi:tripartite-type tricarboxylate transporter receptor subunit TctC
LHFSLTNRLPGGKLTPTEILEEYPMQDYQDLKNLVAEIEADVQKAIGGNKAAGTRVRKQMQKIKQAAQLVRNRILEVRTTE